MQNSANGTSVPLTLPQKCQWHGPRKNQPFLENGLLSHVSIHRRERRSKCNPHILRRNWDRVPEKTPSASHQPVQQKQISAVYNPSFSLFLHTGFRKVHYKNVHYKKELSRPSADRAAGGPLRHSCLVPGKTRPRNHLSHPLRGLSRLQGHGLRHGPHGPDRRATHRFTSYEARQ